MLQPLENVRGLADPLKMFVANWIITPLENSKIKDILSKAEDNNKTTGENLILRCQTFTMPKVTGDTTVVNWGGFERTYAGKQTRAGDWTVTFTETWDSRVMDAMREWVNAYHDYIDGKVSLMSDYTATVTVQLLNPDVYDSTKVSSDLKYDITLYDVFPTSLDIPQINASSSDSVELTCTFHYNFFTMGPDEESQMGGDI